MLLAKVYGLRFPSGDTLNYKETNIPQIFFSRTSAIEANKKWHPETQLTIFRIYMNAGSQEFIKSSSYEPTTVTLWKEKLESLPRCGHNILPEDNDTLKESEAR